MPAPTPGRQAALIHAAKQHSSMRKAALIHAQSGYVSRRNIAASGKGVPPYRKDFL